MYRHLALQSSSLRIVRKQLNCNCSLVRTFASKKSKDEDKGEEKSKLAKSKKKEPYQLEKASKKLEMLAENAKEFKSISPKDARSVSKVIGKPKYFVRLSARSEEEKRKAMPVDDEPVSKIAHGLDERLVEAAQRVAKRISNRMQSKLTEKELIESLNQQKIETEKAKQMLRKQTLKEDYKQSISYQIMAENRKKIKDKQDYSQPPHGSSVEVISRYPPKPVREPSQSMFSRSERVSSPPSRQSLFTGERLNIFDPQQTYISGEVNTLWQRLARNQLQFSAHCAPGNGFEEAIKMTEDGKLWHFPIDNEQGLEEEAQTPFYDHVLLDHLLEPFPSQGPVRQFMELVIMGLSKNPYITVHRKHQTIDYYRKYFEDRNLMITVEPTDGAKKEDVVSSTV